MSVSDKHDVASPTAKVDDRDSSSDDKSIDLRERGALDLALQRRTWRKVDLHIMSVAVLLYLASYIDRLVSVDVKPILPHEYL